MSDEPVSGGRRRFLKDLGLCAAALGLGGGLGPLLGGCGGALTDATVAQTTPESFTFAVIGDPHGGARDNYAFCKAGRLAYKLLSNAVQDINRRGVDFTLVMGDLSDHGKLLELQRTKSVLDGLQAPYIPLAGNHDTMMGDDFASFRQTFGAPEINYSWDYKGFHFVTANCSVGTYVAPLVAWRHEVLTWIKWDLQQHAQQPTFFLCHHNLWDYTSKLTATEPWTYGTARGTDELREILEQSGNVFMALSGHIHSFRYRRATLSYATVGTPVIYPAQIMYYHVYPDRVEPEAVTLSNGSLVNAVYALASPKMRVLLDGAPTNKQYVVPVHPAPAAPGAGSLAAVAFGSASARS